MIGKNSKGWYFRIRVYDYIQGKNIGVARYCFNTKKEAVEAAYRLKLDYTPKEIKRLERSTFESVYQEYLVKRKKEKKITSFYNLVPSLDKNILEYFKGYTINNINHQIFSKWIRQLDSKDLTIVYKNTMLREMKGIAIFIRKNYKVDLTFIEDESPFRSDEFKQEDKKYYSIEQFNTFISHVDEVLYHAMFSTMFYTGLRLGELRALTWNDYYDTYFDIVKSVNTRIIKQTGKMMLTAPKTKNSVRTVTIPEVLNESIKAHYEQCKNKSGFSNAWFIFGDTYPIAETTIRNRLQSYAYKANVHYVNPHGFRHSYITLLYQLGVDELITSKSVGHESILTTRNIYTQISEKQKNDAVMDAFKDIKNHKSK